MAHEAVVHAEIVLKNPKGQLQLFSSTMRAGARLEDFQKYMDKFDNPPPGKTRAYYVVLRPKNIIPKQIDIMYQVALLMMEQNATYAPPCFSCIRVHAQVIIIIFRPADSRSAFQRSSARCLPLFRSSSQPCANRVWIPKQPMWKATWDTTQDTTGNSKTT
jgi:hypothetical protein